MLSYRFESCPDYKQKNMENLIIRIANLLLTFGVGFYGIALMIDTNPEIFKVKSAIFFGLVLVATILHIIVENGKKEY